MKFLITLLFALLAAGCDDVNSSGNDRREYNSDDYAIGEAQCETIEGYACFAGLIPDSGLRVNSRTMNSPEELYNYISAEVKKVVGESTDVTVNSDRIAFKDGFLGILRSKQSRDLDEREISYNGILRFDRIRPDLYEFELYKYIEVSINRNVNPQSPYSNDRYCAKIFGTDSLPLGINERRGYLPVTPFSLEILQFPCPRDVLNQWAPLP